MITKCLPHRWATSAWLFFCAYVLLGGGTLAATPSRGDQLANDGNYAAAVQVFAAAHQQAPRDAHVTAKLARASLLLGEHKQAVDWAKQAVVQAPGNASYRMLLGDAYSHYVNDVSMFSKLGIAHKIRNAYRKAVELDPNNARAHFSLAMFYMMAPGIAGGSDKKADHQIKLLTELNPAMADIARAREATEAEHYAQAESLLRDAVSLATDDGAYIALGRFLASRKRPEDALAVFRKAIKACPKKPDAYYRIGRLAAEGSIDSNEGMKALKTYLGMSIDWRQGDPSFAWAHYQMAQIHQHLGHTDKAVSEYRQALQLKPDFKQAQEALEKLVVKSRLIIRSFNE